MTENHIFVIGIFLPPRYNQIIEAAVFFGRQQTGKICLPETLFCKAVTKDLDQEV